MLNFYFLNSYGYEDGPMHHPSGGGGGGGGHGSSPALSALALLGFMFFLQLIQVWGDILKCFC